MLVSSCALEPPAATVAPSTWTATSAQIRQQLADVTIVNGRPDVPGYDRSCGSGEGCVFGRAWTDNNDGPSGHDSCGERDFVLRNQLRDVQYKPGSTCIVVAGFLDPDPYTGTTIEFTKADASKVQIDHLYPTALAWDMGAWAWSESERIAFANDTEVELLAVDGRANQSKQDSSIGEWLPTNRGYHCQYVSSFLTVAIRYGLPITESDRQTAESVADRCRLTA